MAAFATVTLVLREARPAGAFQLQSSLSPGRKLQLLSRYRFGRTKPPDTISKQLSVVAHNAASLPTADPDRHVVIATESDPGRVRRFCSRTVCIMSFFLLAGAFPAVASAGEGAMVNIRVAACVQLCAVQCSC